MNNLIFNTYIQNITKDLSINSVNTNNNIQNIIITNIYQKIHENIDYKLILQLGKYYTMDGNKDFIMCINYDLLDITDLY